MTSLNNDAIRKSRSKYIDVSERCKNNNHVQESNEKGTTTTVVEDADIDIEIVITTTTSTTSSTTMDEDEKNGEHDQFIQAAAEVIKSDEDFHSSSEKEAGENQPLPSKGSNNKIEQEQIETLKDNNDDSSGQNCCSNNININNNNKQQVKFRIRNIKGKLRSILHHTTMLLLRELIPMICQERYNLQCSSNSKTAAAAATTRSTSSATRRCTFISRHSTNQQQNKTISLPIKTTTTAQKMIQICSKLRTPRHIFLKLSLLRRKISSSTRSNSSNNNSNNEIIRVLTEEQDERDEEEEHRRFNHIVKIICKRILEKNNRIIMKLSRQQQQQQQDVDEHEENNSNRTTTPSSSSTAHNQQHPNHNNKNMEKWYYRDSRRLASAADTTTTQSAYCSMEMISFDKENECFHRKEIAYPYQPPTSSSSYKKCHDSDKANDRQHRYRCLAKTLEVRVTEANNICKYSLIWQ